MSAHILAILVKATLVLLVAWTVTTLMRRRSSAALRHLVWSAALTGVLVLPAAVAIAAAWQLALRLPAWTAGTTGGPTVPGLIARSVRGGSGVAPAAATASTRVRVVDPESLFAVPSTSLPATPRRAVVLILWIVGSVLLLVRLAGGLVWSIAHARRATPVHDAAWISDLRTASDTLGLRRHVPILRSSAVAVPVVCGVVRPKLLVPVSSEDWDADRRLIVLLHELAHVRRGDCVTQLLAQLAFASLWFHPLMTLALVRLRAEQECATDDLVLRAGAPPPEYARHLCEIAEAAHGIRLPVGASLAMAHSSRLGRRIAAILDDATRRTPASRRRSALVCSVAGACVAVLAVVQPALQAASQTRAGSTTSGSAAPVPGQLATGAGAGSDTLDAMVRRYCVTCHGSVRRVAGVSFESASAERPAEAPDLWEKAMRKVRSGTHPPVSPGAPDGSSASQAGMDAAAAGTFVALVEAGLDREDSANWTPSQARPLQDGDVARRIARFLWSAEPDQRLRSSSARLNDPAVLASQLKRMLDDARAQAFVTGFFGEWLYLRNMKDVKPDPARFPGFDDGLRDALQRETELFLRSQLLDDRPVTELLTANYTFLNERLARHYGIANVTGSHFRRVTMPDDARSGLLGQGSILTVTSYSHRTSPVLRGKWVLETLFGVTPPPPPPNVPRMPEPDATVSGRSRLEASVKAPVCASCHATIDPIGFALENFDAIGQWRNTDGVSAIDASGVLAGTPFNGPAELRTILVVRQEAFVHTVAARLLAYALGRELKHYDMPAVRSIVRESESGHYRWSSLINGVVRSTPFRMERISS